MGTGGSGIGIGNGVGGVKGNFRIRLYISLIVSGSEKECMGIQCLTDVGGECISRLRIGGSRATQCAYAWCFVMHWTLVRGFSQKICCPHHTG